MTSFQKVISAFLAAIVVAGLIVGAVVVTRQHITARVQAAANNSTTTVPTSTTSPPPASSTTTPPTTASPPVIVKTPPPVIVQTPPPVVLPTPVPAQTQSDPWAVVSEYYGDVSSKDYPDAWALLGPGMQIRGYSAWVAGYTNTGGRDVTEISESGDQVWYYLESFNPDSSVQWYRASATINNGKMQGADVVQLAGNPNA